MISVISKLPKLTKVQSGDINSEILLNLKNKKNLKSKINKYTIHILAKTLSLTILWVIK